MGDYYYPDKDTASITDKTGQMQQKPFNGYAKTA